MNWYGQPPQGGDSMSPPLWGIVWTSYWTQRQVLLAKRKLYLDPCHVLRWATPAKEHLRQVVKCGDGAKLVPPSHTHTHPVIPMDNHHHLYEKNAILVVHYLKTDPHEDVPKHRVSLYHRIDHIILICRCLSHVHIMDRENMGTQ